MIMAFNRIHFLDSKSDKDKRKYKDLESIEYRSLLMFSSLNFLYIYFSYLSPIILIQNAAPTFVMLKSIGKVLNTLKISI